VNHLKQIIYINIFPQKNISESNKNDIEEYIFALCAGFMDHLKPIHGHPRDLWITG